MRAPKWDWKSHEAKMKELYDQRISIPEIHEAIQCEGFKPCLSSVYSKFRSMNLPTDPIGRTRLLDKLFPQSPIIQAGESMQGIEFSELTNTASPNRYEKELSLVPENPGLQQPIDAWRRGGEASSPTLGSPFQYSSLDEQSKNDQLEENFHPGKSSHLAEFQTPQPDIHPGTPWDPPNNATICEDWGFDQAFDFRYWPKKLTGTASFEHNSAPFNLENLHSGTSQEFDYGMEVQFDAMPCLVENPPFNGPNHEPTFLNHQSNPQCFPKHISNYLSERVTPSSAARSSSSIKKIRSWFRHKSSESTHSRRRYATSQYTAVTGDSGYCSGYTSNISSLDVPNANPRTLEEFNGLYRTACHTLHEPRSKSQWRNIPTCNYCRYSSIHNLAWSARYLKLEVFCVELQLTFYDLGALDAAGNTALHYAAASGAGFRHLKALIDAGVNPYIANTAGELFVHCLRPLRPFSLEPNSDCFDGDDLIHLLNLLQPELAFDWRDNSGQTILHALALKVAEPRLKAKVFRLFDDAGYPATVLDRWGRTAEDIVPLTYDCHGQVINHDSFTNFRNTMKGFKEVEMSSACNGITFGKLPLHPVEQIRAHEIIAESHGKARYIDPETGNNVVHALSRLKSGHDILENLECFIQMDIDLNLHNREGQPPLISFICNRSSEEFETGATMSKYLDLILWKNHKERLRNNINVDMKDREGATALHCAAVRGRPDSTRSLIEAGANVNARLDNGLSILHAAFDAYHAANMDRDDVQVHLLKEVISHLEHAGAVQDPTSLQERGIINS